MDGLAHGNGLDAGKRVFDGVADISCLQHGDVVFKVANGHQQLGIQHFLQAQGGAALGVVCADDLDTRIPAAGDLEAIGGELTKAFLERDRIFGRCGAAKHIEKRQLATAAQLVEVLEAALLEEAVADVGICGAVVHDDADKSLIL